MTRRARRFSVRAIAWASLLTLLASEPIAFALEPGTALAPPSSRTGLLRVVLGLAAAFILAVAAAHPFVRRVERRLGLTVLLSSGLPFLAMGFVFRLPSIGILTDDVVTDLRPALEFGLGWLGFVVGMHFDVRELDLLPEKTGNVVVAESAIPFVATAAVCAITLVGLDPNWTIEGVSFVDQAKLMFSGASIRDALALGACAAPAAPVAAIAIARSSGSAAANIIAKVTTLNDVAGVVVIGLICAFFRPTDALSAWKLPHIAWLFVTLGMGGVLGILTYILVRSARTQAEEMALLLGAIALSAGMSGYLGISPLVSCAIAGALLTNLPHRETKRLRQTMAQVERPLYLIFLLIAGSLWDPRAWQGWVLAPVFVLSRVGGKLIGAHVAKRNGPSELPDASTLGLALAPQSPIAIATIVSYATLYKSSPDASQSVPWLMTAIIAGAVLTEITVQAIVRMRGGLAFNTELRDPSMYSVVPPPVAVADDASLYIPPPSRAPRDLGGDE